MPTIKGSYDPIDIHKAPTGTTWPATIPPLTFHEAERAVRRLFRYGLGRTYEGKVRETHGNRRAVRYAWEGNSRVMHVNAGQGWRDLVHDLSHWLDWIANGSTKHSKHHARFEAKLVREVIARGWLDGKLREEPEVQTFLDSGAVLRAKREDALARLRAREEAWARKLTRAERALAKIAKQARYYEKALG